MCIQDAKTFSIKNLTKIRPQRNGLEQEKRPVG